MSTQAKKTIYDKKGHTAYLTINFPEKANIIDDQVENEMAEAYKDFWEDRNMRCLILTGTGDRHFCAGHDVRFAPGDDAQAELNQDIEKFVWPPEMVTQGRTPRIGRFYPQIWKPVIAAVNGWVAGAGLYTMLTTTDIRVACREHARFYFALLSRRGGIGGGPTPTHLMRQIPYVHAMRMLLTDEPIDAEEAVRIQLVNEAVSHDQLMSRCEEIAQRISEMPPVSVRFLKEFAIRSQDMSFEQAWHLQSTFNLLAHEVSTDWDDATQAFLEKRPRKVTGELRTKKK